LSIYLVTSWNASLTTRPTFISMFTRNVALRDLSTDFVLEIPWVQISDWFTYSFMYIHDIVTDQISRSRKRIFSFEVYLGNTRLHKFEYKKLIK